MESVLMNVHGGRPSTNKGEQYPADPPTLEEIVAVMRAIGALPTVTGSAH